MVVCAMQKYTSDQQLEGCSAAKVAPVLQIAEPENVNSENCGEDREEGEIVDDFEMIISSEDEEFKLRARIQQLEDKSKDIEKMNMLSANLANQYSYHRPPGIERFKQYQHFSPISVLSDVSSLSEGEEVVYDPPKKHRRHKLKRTESKRHAPMYRRNPFASRSHTQHSQAQTRKKRQRNVHHNNHHCHPFHANSNQQETILLDSLDSVTEDEICEYDVHAENENDDYEHRLQLSRNKLRVALARTGSQDIKPKHSLRERLLHSRPHKSPSPERSELDNHIKSEDQPAPHSFEDCCQHRNDRNEVEDQEQQQQQSPELADDMPELKLRLIALKSAILKKHLARKKRDAERAYSPTDMINRVHQPTSNNECDDIDDLMEISPAASPERTAYSPPATTFADPVDMDLAQTDSDEERQQWPHRWQPSANSGGSWRCFMSNSLPPVSMPIVIDDEDEEEENENENEKRKIERLDTAGDEVPPPPPSFHIPQMQLEDDDARDALHLSVRHSPVGTLSDIQSVSMDNSQTQTQTSRPFQVESSDDEAGALRAMLLSKLKPADVPTERDSLPTCDGKEVASNHDSDDPEELRQLLLSSIASKKKNCPEQNTCDSPEILKNAVRRFQTSALYTLNDTPLPVMPHDPPSKSDQTEHQATADTGLVFMPKPIPMTSTDPEPAHLPLSLNLPMPEPPAPVAIPTSQPATETVVPLNVPLSSGNIIKIVKPNKVINKKTVPKRKGSKLAEPVLAVKRPTTLLVKESMAPLHSHNSNSSTRLITTIDPSSIKVNRLVITLADSSAGSDDELELRSCCTYSSYSKYTGIGSPLSQPVDSASNSTTRSNTPNSEILDSTTSSNPNLRRTIINEYFEKKLDDFLKLARSKVPSNAPMGDPILSSDADKPSHPPARGIGTVVTPSKTKPTPVAVRHLPVASQKEYLRLIERMQLLEKRKINAVKVPGNQTTVTTADKTSLSASKKGVTKTSDKTALAAVKGPTINNVAGHKGSKLASTASSSKLVSEPNNSSEHPSTSGVATKATQPSKESRLKAFENSFFKIGGSMISNLDKSLQMVEEAKKSKIARLQYAQRLKDLFAEMQTVKQAVKLEETKLSRIQPEIQASHEIITSLMQKRNKLHNAAVNLGTGLQGADYRLPDPDKDEIAIKSSQLTKVIRQYNTIIKYEDIPVDEVPKSAAKAELDSNSEPEPEKRPVSAIGQKSLGERDSQLPAEGTKPSEAQPIKCDTPPIVGEAKAEAETRTDTVEARLEVDTAPTNPSLDAADGADASPLAASVTLETLSSVSQAAVPLYIDNQMQELYQPPAKRSLLCMYRTVMPHNYNSKLDVNATVCPFELMGRCEDADCGYLHLGRVLAVRSTGDPSMLMWDTALKQ